MRAKQSSTHARETCKVLLRVWAGGVCVCVCLNNTHYANNYVAVRGSMFSDQSVMFLSLRKGKAFDTQRQFKK